VPVACVEWMPVEMVQGSLESQCMAVKETERSTEEEGKACWKKLVPLATTNTPGCLVSGSTPPLTPSTGRMPWVWKNRLLKSPFGWSS